MAGFAETFRDLDVYQNGLAVNAAYLRPIWETLCRLTGTVRPTYWSLVGW
jgi:hypothetical protein